MLSPQKMPWISSPGPRTTTLLARQRIRRHVLRIPMVLWVSRWLVRYCCILAGSKQCQCVCPLIFAWFSSLVEIPNEFPLRTLCVQLLFPVGLFAAFGVLGATQWRQNRILSPLKCWSTRATTYIIFDVHRCTVSLESNKSWSHPSYGGPPPDFCWSVWKHSISCQGCSPQLTDDSQDMICQMLSQVEMLLFHQSEMLPGPADTSSRCRASAVLICLRTWVQWWPTFGPGKPRLFRLCSTEKTWNRCVHPLYLLALEADDRLLIRVSIFSTLGEPDGWKTDHPHF